MKSAWPEYWPPEASSTGCVVGRHRVAVRRAERRHRHGVALRAAAVQRVRRVLLVVVAEGLAVPAVREVDVQAEVRRPGTAATFAVCGTFTQVAAVPPGDGEPLRRSRLRVPGDDLEAGRERPQRRAHVAAGSRRSTVVGDDRVARRRRASASSRRPCRPARRQVVLGGAQLGRRRERVGRVVADERVVVREARLAGQDDRVVGAAVAEAADADEVDAAEGWGGSASRGQDVARRHDATADQPDPPETSFLACRSRVAGRASTTSSHFRHHLTKLPAARLTGLRMRLPLEPAEGPVSCVIERSSMQKKVWLSGAMAALGAAMLVAAAFAGPASSKSNQPPPPGRRRAGR